MLRARPAQGGQGGVYVNCMIALFGLLFPRLVIVYWWFTDASRWTAVFGSSPILPLLGFLFLPWTTLMYVFFWTQNGLDLLGWVIVFIAFLGDIGTYGGGFLGNRERVESYYR